MQARRPIDGPATSEAPSQAVGRVGAPTLQRQKRPEGDIKQRSGGNAKQNRMTKTKATMPHTKTVKGMHDRQTQRDNNCNDQDQADKHDDNRDNYQEIDNGNDERHPGKQMPMVWKSQAEGTYCRRRVTRHCLKPPELRKLSHAAAHPFLITSIRTPRGEGQLLLRRRTWGKSLQRETQ